MKSLFSEFHITLYFKVAANSLINRSISGIKTTVPIMRWEVRKYNKDLLKETTLMTWYVSLYFIKK